MSLTIDFKRGSHFSCPECAKSDCSVNDTNTRTWRHLDFFQHQAYLTARVLRIQCAKYGVKQLAVLWARPGSGYNLLFETYSAICFYSPTAVILFLEPFVYISLFKYPLLICAIQFNYAMLIFPGYLIHAFGRNWPVWIKSLFIIKCACSLFMICAPNLAMRTICTPIGFVNF